MFWFSLSLFSMYYWRTHTHIHAHTCKHLSHLMCLSVCLSGCVCHFFFAPTFYRLCISLSDHDESSHFGAVMFCYPRIKYVDSHSLSGFWSSMLPFLSRMCKKLSSLLKQLLLARALPNHRRIKVPPMACERDMCRWICSSPRPWLTIPKNWWQGVFDLTLFTFQCTLSLYTRC